MIDSDRLPYVRQGVRLIVEGGGRHSTQLIATVVEIEKSGRMSVLFTKPVQTEQLHQGMSVVVEYFRDAIVHRMNTKVEKLGTAPEGREIERASLDAPKDVERIQRRRAKRLLVACPMRYITIGLPADYDKNPSRRGEVEQRWTEQLARAGQAVFSESLSSSGFKMLGEPGLSLGDHVYVQIQLDDGELTAVGRVVWLDSKKMPRETAGVGVGIEFEAIGDDLRERIERFVTRENERRRLH